MKRWNPALMAVAAAALFAALMIGLFLGRQSARRFVYVGEIAAESAQREPAEPPLNVNTASAEELQRIDGIDEELAGRIVRSREFNGAFDSTEDLLRIEGFSQKILDEQGDRLTVK